ncbi:MAG: nitroreductase [Gemmatimonadetes bacterium]|nr:nitroreductase [Gemmatimonadota bacterium]
MKLSSSDVDIPASAVSVYEAIFRRRHVKTFTAGPVSRAVLERLFSAAIWAPNHRLTEPTRFFVVEKDGPMRTRIAEAAWQAAYDEAANPSPERKRRAADGKRDRALDAPAMVYVYSLPGDNDEVTRENYATACCAIQNMALAAVAEGLGVDWSTGGLTRIPGLAGMLGADEAWTMVGVVCLGRAAALPTTERTPHSEVVTWLD